MKRLSSSDSLGGLMSICPDSAVDVDEHEHDNNPMYTRDFQTMLEEECQISEKKRRLSVDQVKALEKNFEVENKLEPERKVKLAQELGLQPRQVAVWFQNRRARWKTKQLERDYGLLKANHDALNHKYESLQRQNESLLNEFQELKSKLKGKISVKEEASTSLCEIDSKEKCQVDAVNLENCDVKENERVGDFKDGSSDSDSSVILNEDNNCSPIISSSAGIIVLHQSPLPFLDNNSAVSTRFEFTDAVYQNQTQLLKIEEHDFFGEESCTTLFSDDQAPTLHWYCNDDWN